MVEIEWEDIASEVTWGEPELDTATVKEIGWVVGEDRKKVILCSQIAINGTNTDNHGNRTAIPKVVIKKVRYL